MAIPLLAVLLGSSTIKVGDSAPDFTLPDTEGKPITLSQVLEDGPVILFFFPKAFTPGCTRQTSAFRDRFADVGLKGAQVLGISTDSVETLRRFKEKLQAPYPLLSDAGGAVSKKYVGVMPVVGVANRANIVVGEDGVVKEVTSGGDAVDPSAAIRACPLRRDGS
jgi:peroxiredoxin Q/BCP